MMNAAAVVVREKLHLIMTVLADRDLERSARFYEETFGWPAGLKAPVPEGSKVYRQL